jgi:multidrug efflux pump subunit AcrB
MPFDPTGTIPLGILTVSNPNLAEQEVKDLARVDIRNRLGTVKGCVAPVVVGGKDRQVMIYLKRKELEARNLSPVDVVKALDQGNLLATPGTAYIGDSQIALDSNSMARTMADLNLLPVVFEADRHILLKDIANAEDDAVIQKSRVRVNGRPQVMIPIYRQQGASSLTVADGVNAAIPEMLSELPPGTKLDYVVDQTDYVRKAIESLVEEGIIGGILVSIMILVFLGNWRMTVIATLALPLSIFGAIIGLKATGNTINVMTLGGLFLAIGPLVDNAIVVQRPMVTQPQRRCGIYAVRRRDAEPIGQRLRRFTRQPVRQRRPRAFARHRGSRLPAVGRTASECGRTAPFANDRQRRGIGRRLRVHRSGPSLRAS